jgi:hypothetical protein
MASGQGFDGVHCRVQPAGHLVGRLGSRVGDAERMPGERERLQVVSLGVLDLFPVLDRGLSRRHHRRGLRVILIRLGPSLTSL